MESRYSILRICVMMILGVYAFCAAARTIGKGGWRRYSKWQGQTARNWKR